MTDAESMYEDFIASRRSGRRNAVPLVDLPIVLPADPAASQAGDSSDSTSATELSHDLAQLRVNKSVEGEDPEKTPDTAAKEDKEEEVEEEEAS